MTPANVTPYAEPIFRAPMRSRAVDAAPGAGAQFAVARGLAGIGERLDRPPPSLAEAAGALARAHGEKARRMLWRFAHLPEGTRLWTRLPDGTYRLGTITGTWRYEDSPEARRVGIHHVRPAAWWPAQLTEAEVPLAVARTFARGGRNLQRIHDDEAERWTTRRLAEWAA